MRKHSSLLALLKKGFTVVLPIIALGIAIGVFSYNRGEQPMLSAPPTQNHATENALHQPTQNVPTVVFQHDLHSWRYKVLRAPDGSRQDAIIMYDRSSVTGIKQFAEANAGLITDVAARGGQDLVMITYRAPVDVGQFRQWARLLDLNVQEVQLREKVGRVTIGIPGTKDDPLPQAALSTLPHGGISGVINTLCFVPADRLSSLVSDPLVFMVDVTPTWIKYDLERAHIPGADKTRLSSIISPFYDMETLGLENFSSGSQLLPTGTAPPPVNTAAPTIPVPIPSVVPTWTASR